MCLYQLQLLNQAPLLSWRLLHLFSFLFLLPLLLHDLWFRLGLLGLYSLLLLVDFRLMRFRARLELRSIPARNRQIREHVVRVGWIFDWSRQ